MKLPIQLYTVDQVRAMDRYAIDVIGIAGIELMTRAGQCAWEHPQFKQSFNTSLACRPVH